MTVTLQRSSKRGKSFIAAKITPKLKPQQRSWEIRVNASNLCGMKNLFTTLVALIIVSFSITLALAEDWTQFRGPNGTGVSTSKGVPETFGPSKNVVWKTELPPGHSSPVLTRDRIFVTAYRKVPTATAKKHAHAFQASPIEKENYKLLVIALDRASGKIVWEREVPRTRTGR